MEYLGKPKGHVPQCHTDCRRVFGFHNTDARMTVSETGQTGSRRRLPQTGVLLKRTRRPGKELVSASSGHGKIGTSRRPRGGRVRKPRKNATMLTS